ncbi:hypothetical protein H072_821 [Dactylellina haptotyla CBS 200.50]|uniref:Uncharacterized protein n=1 Tax=Dactylellina haptotyla (strain CBS 200.50) TaxID=1284197 RepID=S8AQF5_DACHA|nr:hypothetical protein H072_821 [Dactylellina haptotyla CBS 200.50]
MAGAVEWSRNGADTADSEQFAADAQLRFSQQSDPDGLLKAPRHYIPVFVLHAFCKSERPRPFVLPDAERVAKIKAQVAAQKKLIAACPSWEQISRGNDIQDDETFIIFDTRTKRFDKFHWTECFKFDEPYLKFFEKFTMKEFTREGWKFQKFEKLQRVDYGIQKGIWTNTYKIYDAMELRKLESSDMIRLKRSDVWEFRKFLFLMTFLRNRDRNTHLLGTSEAMVEAKEKRATFMGVHNLNHPRDLWLHNASIILDTPHHQVSYHKLLFDLDQEDYRTNARERFLVFWEAGPNDEFILTDNSFGGMEVGRLEAKHTMPKRLKPSDLQKRLYSRDFMWHQIFVLSPKLAVALCHGTMINSTLIREHRDRYGLRLSLLDKLPHPLPQGYYKDMHIKECRFIKPEWKIPGEVEELFGRPADKGKYAANLDVRANNELEFMVSTLSSAQVGLVNMVLLQNQSITTAVDSVVYRNPAALYRAIEEYSKHDWPIFTDEKQHSYKSFKRKIFNQFNKPANGHDSGKSSSGSSDPGTRSSASSSRRSDKKFEPEERKKPAPEPPKPVKKPVPESSNPFMSDSESSDEDDDPMAFPLPKTVSKPISRERSPSPVRRTESPLKNEVPLAPPKPVETPAPVKMEPEPVKPVQQAPKPPVQTPAPLSNGVPNGVPEPAKEKLVAPEPPKPTTNPAAPAAVSAAVEAAAEKAIADKLEKAKSEEMERLEKEMLEKERVLREEREAIERLRREKQELEAELEQRRKEDLEAARMERQKSDRNGRRDDREAERRERARSENRERDERVRAQSSKSADNRRRPRSKDRAEAELVDVGKQLALLEMEREKVRKEKQELEELQQRRRREAERESQKKFERLQKDMAILQRQLEEERHEKELVKRMAAKEKEMLKNQADALVRQTRELREAQERDQARAEVERAARAEKERLERLEKEKQRDLEKAKDRELKKRQERERLMNEKAEQERVQREREIQAEKEREAERTRRQRDREQERAARTKNRQSRYDMHDRQSDASDELDAQALYRKNRMMLGALSPTSDPGMHLRYDEMTPPSSSHSHPDQFDDRRFEPMRSQSPPSPRLGYQYPPSPRRVDTSPVPLGANHRRGTQPKMLALEYETPPSSGFQTSPESPNPPLDLALYAPPKEKSSRRKGEGRDREQPRDARGGPPPNVRRFEPPAPLPSFNELDRRLNKIPNHVPRELEYPGMGHNGDRYPDDDYDEDDYGNGYPDAMARYDTRERAPKKRLQIEPPPQPISQPQYKSRQKGPMRALPPPDYRNGR